MKDLSEIQYATETVRVNDANSNQTLNNEHKQQQQSEQQQTSTQFLNQQKTFNLPKTFSTKKGPLLIFSDHITGSVSSGAGSSEMINGHQINLNSNRERIFAKEYICENDTEIKSLKTINDLRKSILEFGHIKNVGESLERENFAKIKVNRQNTLESLSFLRQHRKDDLQFEKIRPGLSAKRYLANWTRHWRPDLLENLSKDGKLKEENLFEESEVLPNVKLRINDDLSRIPPLYQIQRKWLSMNVPPLKGYRFYRAKTDIMGLSILFFK